MSIDETTSPTLLSTYEEAIQYLFGRIDYERSEKIPYGSRVFKLDRMHRFVELLGDPVKDIPLVHIAGTKGKGSTSEILASMVGQSGYRVGQYTSPHLERLEERFCVNHQNCSQQNIVELLNELAPVIRQLDDDQEFERGPTFFEITTAMALLHFRNQKVDLGILEVGLGGRLDSTNVCQPVVSVITSISHDHMALLGNTLPEIAAEKAGIIKPQVPVVSGVLAEDASLVIKQIAQQQQSPLYTIGEDYKARLLIDSTNRNQHPYEQRFDVQFSATGFESELKDLAISLKGAHQVNNAATAIAVTQVLKQRGFNITVDQIRQGLKSVQLPARIECLSTEPAIIVDSAHNDASISALTEVINHAFECQKKRLVLALSSDKEHSKILELLLPHFDEIWLTQYQSNPRKAHPESLAKLAKSINHSCKIHVEESSMKAFEQAMDQTNQNDLLCVTGSFFIAAEFRKFYQKKNEIA